MTQQILPVLLALLLCGCETDLQPPKITSPFKNPHGAKEVTLSTLDIQLKKLIVQHRLKGDPARKIDTPDINSPKAQLGKKLFFSRALSGELNVACASCHHPLMGGGDNLSLPIGTNNKESHTPNIDLYHQGSLGPEIARNVPTTFNVALWKQALFHDGRIQKVADGGITTPDVNFPQADPLAGSDLVQAQARFPLTPDSKMRSKPFDSDGTTQSFREKRAERLGGYGSQTDQLTKKETEYWLKAFRLAFNAPDGLPKTVITEQNISASLSAFQRSQTFTHSHWKSYVSGDYSAISDTAKNGALLFYRQRNDNGYGCVNCHTGDFFSNEQFYHTLLPPVGPGRLDKDGKLISSRDLGRSLITGNTQDRFKFRVPSLLNVEVTGPWGHNGAYTTLANMVRHMINPYDSAVKYDHQQLLQSSMQVAQMRQNIGEMLACNVDIVGKPYTNDEVQSLVAFLLTLTDPCVKDHKCMSPWVADTNDIDPMKLLLMGANKEGKQL